MDKGWSAGPKGPSKCLNANRLRKWLIFVTDCYKLPKISRRGGGQLPSMSKMTS